MSIICQLLDTSICKVVDRKSVKSRKRFTLFLPPRLVYARLHPHFLLYHTLRNLSSDFRIFLYFFVFPKVGVSSPAAIEPKILLYHTFQILSSDFLHFLQKILLPKGFTLYMLTVKCLTCKVSSGLHVNCKLIKCQISVKCKLDILYICLTD